MARNAGPTFSFENEERARLLGVIDQFRELGVGEDTSLPQLVVVGDQSSGKSSLLEGLTGLAFPVASDLCTRFATQIVLRRTAITETESICVSIIPGPEAKGDEDIKQRLEQFAQDVDPDDFSFEEVLSEAAECMGLPGPGTEATDYMTKRFSDDVLKIELAGPNHPHLSVVDVPGLFHNATKNQTLEDAVIIRQLIESYLKDRRTIILAVMDGRQNLANQEVFQMARNADKDGRRTVGIITKLDALQEGETKGAFKIASNEFEYLHHGWFVVKNRSPQEIEDGISIEQRHIREAAFFKTAPWDKLDASRKGVLVLKDYLGKLLYDHIHAEFPELLDEIRKKRNEFSSELDKFGQSRQTSSDKRRYLTKLATEYQRVLDQLLTGIYPDGLSQDHPLRIRMHLHAKNEAFGQAMTKQGHTRPFKTAKDEFDIEYLLDDLAIDEDAEGTSAKKEIIDIYEWIRELYRRGRGVELPGTVNQFLIAPSFREQSKKWHGLASRHISEVFKVVYAANQQLFQLSISDEIVRERVQRRLSESLNESYARAEKWLEILIDDERNQIPQTVNDYFSETRDAIHSARLMERFGKAREELKSDHPDGEWYTTAQLNMLQIHVSSNITNEQQAVYEIHDLLKSYYKVALKRFVDNVIVQIVERIFIVEGPLKIFTAEYIAGLSDVELSSIAAEDFTVAARRKELEMRIERLEKAVNIAKTLA